MEDGLKQRIYENILRFLENYRYIKSTAEATMPNFMMFYISFVVVAFYRAGVLPLNHDILFKL